MHLNSGTVPELRWGHQCPGLCSCKGVRVRYYIEDNAIRIHRMDDAVCQTYDFAQGRWVHSMEIMGMFIGELWADEVSEAEANSVTPCVAAESTPCDNGIDSSGQKTMPAAKGERQSRIGTLSAAA